MNTQDRAVVKALLQYMTDKCLTGSDEFRAAMVYFDVTTTWEATKYLPEIAAVMGEKQNEIVDVFSAANGGRSERFTFGTAQEAKTFALNARASGDEPVNQRVLDAREIHFATLAKNIEIAHDEALKMNVMINIQRDVIAAPYLPALVEACHAEALEMNDAYNTVYVYAPGDAAREVWEQLTAIERVVSVDCAHAAALEMDAEFNFERVSRAINQSAHKMQLRQYYWFELYSYSVRADKLAAAHAEALEMDRQFNIDGINAARRQRQHRNASPERQARWLEQDHAEALEINQSRNETVRAIIAQALHVGANSFGHVLGEHEELVATLCNAGFVSEADRVDAAMNAIGGDNHKAIRRNWLEALRKVSASL